MSKLPAPHENAGIVARLSIGGGIAALAAFFPRHAAALAMIPPFAIAALEARCKRCEGILIEALRKGGIEDLSSEKAAAFIPMGLRLMQAAQQGEYDHNLRLLASYLVAGLQVEPVEPGGFLDMARRLEGLDRRCLQAAACMKLWFDRKGSEGIEPRRTSITAALLANPEAVERPMDVFEAMDALSDLAGRGFLTQRDGGLGIGGTGGEFYVPTRPLLDLLSEASALAVDP